MGGKGYDLLHNSVGPLLEQDDYTDQMSEASLLPLLNGRVVGGDDNGGDANRGDTWLWADSDDRLHGTVRSHGIGLLR